MARRDPRIVKTEAAIALDKGKHKKALKAYLELEELEPDDGEWPRRAADMYRRLGQPRLAVASLETAADRYVRVGFLVKAIAVCKMILQIEPGHPGVQARLATLNEQRGIPEGRGVQSAADAGGASAPAAPTPAAPAGAPAAPVPVPAVRPPAAPAPAVPAVRPPAAPAPAVPAVRPPAAPTPAAPAVRPPAAPTPAAPAVRPPAAPTPAAPAVRPPAAPASGVSLARPPEQGRPAVLGVIAVKPPGPPPSASPATPRPTPPGPPPSASPATPPGPPRPPMIQPRPAPAPARQPQTTPAALAALAADAPRQRRRSRRRTLPPDAPLDSVSLGDVVPGAIPELTLDGQDSGIIEIPIEIVESGPVADGGIRPADERVLRETPLLSALGPDALRRLVAEVSLVELAPAQVLFREGEPGRTLYVIAEGAVSVISEGPPRKQLSQLHEGDFFGEIAIVTNHARSATIEGDAERGAHLLAIDRNVIGNLIEEEPAVLQAILRFLRDRLVDRLIHTSPLFAPYAGDEGRYLASLFRFLEVQPGAVILEQGVKASGLFVLLAGRLEGVRVEGGEERVLGAIGPGGVCGEMSLLAGQGALFTVRAASKAFILQLPAEVFREVIMTHPQVLMFVSDLADERRRRYEAVVAGELDYDDTDRISLV